MKSIYGKHSFYFSALTIIFSVIVLIFGKNLGSFEPGSGNWSKIKDAYNEIYGNNSWEEDWELHHKSLLNGAYGNGWGNSVELLEFIPELSSPLLD